MTKQAYLNAVFRTALVVGASLLIAGGTAVAQKQGGSITVGQELDIPGFDPLKVGVYDTSAQSAAALIFDTLTYLDDKGEPQPKLALSWNSFRRLQELDLQAAPRRHIPRRYAI